MVSEERIEVELTNDFDKLANSNIEETLYDLDSQMKMLSSQADKLDYLVSASSGILCGMLDIFWVGEFNLGEGRSIAEENVNDFVIKTSNLLGCKEDDLKSCVAYLERKFPIAADGNTPDFGGGLQHHLRDFAHHPTAVGLIFSLLTQFTEKSYGTDTNGHFISVKVPEKSRIFIGNDVPDKILKGTVIWFFHLVSDMAGSRSTAGLNGGTGIPGPILSMAKEFSSLPLFNNINDKEDSLSKLLSKLFNGTLFAKHDENGRNLKDTVVKFDLRGELGVAVELGKQALPVIANECLVRAFYFIRRFGIEIKDSKIDSIKELASVDWNKIKPYNNPTLTRMLAISTGVFTTIDITDAVVKRKYWVSVNYVGIGRFAVAIGSETANALKTRKFTSIKNMYKTIEQNTYMQKDNTIYENLNEGMDFRKLGLTIAQTEILYNIEYYKTLNDIENTNLPVRKDTIISLKQDWLQKWRSYMESGFPDFVQYKDAKLHWYSEEELVIKIEENEPSKTWLRLVLLESMLFEPYYPLSIQKDKKGNDIPSKKYDALKTPMTGYSKSEGDKYLDGFFLSKYYQVGYVRRLRKCYDKVTRELNEVLKTTITSLSITAVITITVIATAGTFAPAIATAIVGSQFAGLSGAALTSACLAYIGGGAIAIGGAGMAGGTAIIVGGGAVLGLGVGSGVCGTVGVLGILNKKATIQQTAKLMVSVREIFLNDEHDLEYTNTIYKKYSNKITELEKCLLELKIKSDVASKKEKKKLKLEIKNAEGTIEAMRIARKSMMKYNSSFEIGMQTNKLLMLKEESWKS